MSIDRRDFLAAIGAWSGLAIPEWTIGEPEVFTAKQPGARIALETDLGVIKAQRVGLKEVHDFNFVVDECTWVADRPMVVSGAFLFVPISMIAPTDVTRQLVTLSTKLPGSRFSLGPRDCVRIHYPISPVSLGDGGAEAIHVRNIRINGA